MARLSQHYPKASYWDEYIEGRHFHRYCKHYQEQRAWDSAIEQGVQPRRRRSPRLLEAVTDQRENRIPVKNWKYTRSNQYYDGPRPLCALIAGIEDAAAAIVHLDGLQERMIVFPPIQLEGTVLVLDRVMAHARWSDVAWPWFTYLDKTVTPLPHLPEEKVLERGTVFDLFRRAQVKWHITDLEESDLIQLWERLRPMARELKKEYNRKSTKCYIEL